MVYGTYDRVPGFKCPRHFLLNEENDENEFICYVGDAENVMVSNIKDNEKVRDYFVFTLICPKSLCDELLSKNDNEERNPLWV